MKLSERLNQQPSGTSDEPVAEAPTSLRLIGERLNESKGTADPINELKSRIHEALFARLGVRLFDPNLTEDQLRTLVLNEIGSIIEQETTPLSSAERRRLVSEISDDTLGLGPVERFLADGTITEIMVNGSDPIYIEREGKIQLTEAHFITHDHLRRVIERIVGAVGRRIDESSPMVDARLPNGSRVNAIIPPLAVDGPALTIRKFSEDPYTADDLVNFSTLTPDVVSFISACVRGKLNVLVTGGTGTGKTTLLNVVSSFIPSDERIVTIEDAVELRLNQENIVRLEARPANIEGKGQVTIRDLLRNSLRMRPDRIIVGEVRGGEALDMLQAMNTGHEGSLSTVHANTPRDALARVETMVLMAGMDLPTRAIREQVASAIDVIIHLTRFRDGVRRVSHVTEVEGMEGDIITLQDIFLFDYSAGIGEDGHFLGTCRPTGLRPKFSTRLSDQGIALPAGIFGAVDVLGNGSARRP